MPGLWRHPPQPTIPRRTVHPADPASCYQLPSLVGQGTGLGSGTSFNVTIPDPSPGDTLILWGGDKARNGTESVAGGGATSWDFVFFRGDNFGLTCWVGRNCSGAGGLTTVTYTMPSSATVRHANVSVWSGLDLVTPVTAYRDGSSTNTANPSLLIPYSPTNTGYMVAVDWQGTQTIGAAVLATNLTQSTDGGASNHKTQAAYNVFAPVGGAGSSTTPSWTLSAATDTDVFGIMLLAAECETFDPSIYAGAYQTAEPTDWLEVA